jgi:MFS family permease
VGALAPSLAWLTASQVIARGFVTSATIASGILLAETMPKGARAWAIGITAMAAAVGAGTCVVALPLAGLGTRGWRILFAAALLWLGVIALARRHVVESQRFVQHQHDPPATRPPIDRSRLALLAAANFCLMAFVTPGSEFQNEYLRRERHFSPSRIALFVVVTVLPGALGIVVGGRLADTRGRRIVGLVAVVGVTVFGVAAFSVGGWPMWATTALAATTGSAVTPALAVYGPELFATGRRGAANGLLTAAGRAGAVVGLLTVGGLSQYLGRFGPAFAVLAIGPAILAVLIVTRFPETARRSLEDLNPADVAPADQ